MIYFSRRTRALVCIWPALLIGLLQAPSSHAARPPRFHQAAGPIRGLFGSEIGDVVWSGRYLWVATERGLARWDPGVGNGLSPEDWITYTEANGLGHGSVSALAASGDTVWAARKVGMAPAICKLAASEQGP